ncbi:hypothetical protein [Paenibacillus radicis (ex Xue et al. 2023)]|uniref:Uncharacterized protein n=1 Tax=Paenibacillus radicis (ex Xue et al. 2023) TaxID=2972489 RepID=A0ABT1YHS0_9BACL|nr:hypothetical protein [Paenibacillus radicis (ex Xue et al. 2023)]MCR8631783.1 hypothetical protein [Paenibacillus radicis (ex Xue et al. 2023)]
MRRAVITLLSFTLVMTMAACSSNPTNSGGEKGGKGSGSSEITEQQKGAQSQADEKISSSGAQQGNDPSSKDKASLEDKTSQSVGAATESKSQPELKGEAAAENKQQSQAAGVTIESTVRTPQPVEATTPNKARPIPATEPVPESRLRQAQVVEPSAVAKPQPQPSRVEAVTPEIKSLPTSPGEQPAAEVKPQPQPSQ